MNDMENTKHTPAPWKVLVGGGEDLAHPGVDTEDESLSIVILGFKDSDEDDGGVRGSNYNEALANAHLIAAAPDLLEALKAMVDKFDSEIHSEYDDTSMLKDRLSEANFARLIIAKAEGRAE
jgi:hypothetical protein